MTKARAILNQVNLVAGDLNATAAFYRIVGVEIPELFSGSSGEPFHASCDAGEVVDFDFDSPAFAQYWNAGWKGRTDLAGRVVVGFRIATREEVDARYAELVAAGHKGLQEPHDAFWGARYAIVEDPNGVAVGLMSEMDPARRHPPAGWTG